MCFPLAFPSLPLEYDPLRSSSSPEFDIVRFFESYRVKRIDVERSPATPEFIVSGHRVERVCRSTAMIKVRALTRSPSTRPTRRKENVGSVRVKLMEVDKTNTESSLNIRGPVIP